VTIIVSEIDRAIGFYKDVLGLKLDSRLHNQYAVLKTEGLTIGLNRPQHELRPGKC
jgi:catechol 2,3-dioxygenase-like lactoylglutathione lyase family enzyme